MEAGVGRDAPGAHEADDKEDMKANRSCAGLVRVYFRKMQGVRVGRQPFGIRTTENVEEPKPPQVYTARVQKCRKGRPVLSAFSCQLRARQPCRSIPSQLECSGFPQTQACLRSADTTHLVSISSGQGLEENAATVCISNS